MLGVVVAVFMGFVGIGSFDHAYQAEVQAYKAQR